MRCRVLVAACLAAAPLAIVAACSFPDVTFAPPSGGTSGGSEGGPGSETGAGTEAGSEASGGGFFNDGSAGEAATREAGGLILDADICKTRPPCDCDEDGYLADGCDAGPNPGKDAGDCDDLDPLAHPGQDWVAEAPTPKTKGDWNCDNTVEKGIAEGAWCSYQALSGCSTNGPGFDGTIECGKSAALNDCVSTSVLPPKCGLKFNTTANPNPRPQVCK